MASHRPARTTFLAVPAAALVLLLAGCGGGGSDDAPASGSSSALNSQADRAVSDSATAEKAAPGVAASPGPAGGGTAYSGGAAPSGGNGTDARSSSSALTTTALATQRVRTADLAVRVKDVPRAADAVRAAADRFGGSVANEKSESGPKDTIAQNVLTLRVPEPQLDEAIAAVVATGTELSRTASSDDVTGVLADLGSREASARASVARVRALMEKASTLSDVVLLESELSRRESDLEAAQASRRALADQAAQATLTVTLTTGAVVTPPPAPDTGFSAGLKRSWHAVQVSTTLLLTVLGALLPIAALLAVIGWPAMLLTRRLRTRAAAPPAASPAP